jgi:protein-S-isoprenylcysteine O-methyltransferase Ste14
MPESKFIKTVYAWRIRTGIIGIILAIILAKPEWYSLLGCIVVTILGLLIRAWACGHLKKEKELTMSGPYRFTRNPLYVGNMLLGLAVAIGANSWWVFTIFFVHFCLFYTVAIKREKERMQTFFPEEYKLFSQKVPIFFPTFFPKLKRGKARFKRELYIKNKEYRTLYTSVLFWIVLILKMLVFPL